MATAEKEEEFRPLPDEYKLYGYIRKLEVRKDKGVIYSCTSEETPDAEPTHYEVFCIREAKAVDTMVKGNHVKTPRREKLPSNEDFGVWAWTTKTREKADEILEEIEAGTRPDTTNAHRPEDDEPIVKEEIG